MRTSLNRLVAVLSVAIVLTSIALSASAQQRRVVRVPAGELPALDTETRTAIVESVAEQLANGYIFEDVGHRYAAALREHLSDGAYEEITDPLRLAELLTRQLNAVSADGHLRVELGTPGMSGPGRRVVRVGPGADGGDEAAGPAPRPVRVDPREMRLEDMPEGMRSMMEARIEEERKQNFFFRAVEVLPGNVGYLDYDRFGFLPESRDVADAAMGFLAGTDAIILDLRANGGGVEGMNQYLASFFFGDEPVHLYSRERRDQEDAHFYSWPDESPLRFPDKPLYVLVDRATGSAAENLSFALQGLGRATLVGEPTAGAAHSSTRAPLPGGLELVLPISRVYDPRTGEDWEGVGVQPDVAADPDQALAAAHGQAIEGLLVDADPRRAVELEDARMLVAAMRSGGAGAESGDLEDYVGDYGRRRVWIEDGELKLQRTDMPDAPEVDLQPLGDDLFTLRQMSSVRIRFERDESDAVVRVQVRQPDGRWEASDRVDSDDGGGAAMDGS